MKKYINFSILEMFFAAFVFSSLLSSFLLISMPVHAQAEKKAHIFAVSGVVEAEGQTLQVFSDYLTKKSAYPLKTAYAPNYAQLSKMLAGNADGLGWTCGAPYVADHIKHGQQFISVPLFKGQPTYYSLVISRKGRPEKSLADFKGQILAYSDENSNSGFISPAYALHKAGLDMNTHFRRKIPAFNHVGSIEAVLSGSADVAAVDEYILVEYLKKKPQMEGKLQVLEKHGPYPFTPIVAGKDVPQEVIDKVAAALKDMQNTPEGKKLLDEFGLDGFVDIPSEDFYKPIEDMMRTLGRI